MTDIDETNSDERKSSDSSRGFDFLSSTSVKVAADPKYSLKGNTMRVYMHILRGGKESVGVREIQRDLNFSSPTLARYHLEKLRDMGLLAHNEEDGSYSMLREVKVDVLQPFVSLGSFIIPRLFTYAVMISILFAYLIAFVLPSGSLVEIEYFSLVIGASALGALWYETIRSWRNRPR